MNENTGEAEIDDLRTDVYGKGATNMSVDVTESFSLSFKCTALSGNYPKSGTWECTDIHDLYAAIKIGENFLVSSPYPSFAVDKITVTDNYLENNDWEIAAIINLDPNDIDGFPVYGLTRFATENIARTGKTYPYIKSVTDKALTIALGYIKLPDDNVTVKVSFPIMIYG